MQGPASTSSTTSSQLSGGGVWHFDPLSNLETYESTKKLDGDT